MCGRYTLTRAEKLANRFNLAAMHPSEFQANYNVTPGQFMPVVRYSSSANKVVLERMKWGLVPFWAKNPNIGYKLINARSETLFEKPMWRKLINRKRVLIPADGFYEWDKIIGNGKKVEKVPYYIKPKQDKLFTFAGVWDTWKDVEGLEWKTYSIITTEANKEVSRLHDRMPVILHQEDETSWLDPAHNDDRSAIEALLRPYEDGGLEMYEVSRDVNVTRNNDKKLIYPINSQ